MREKRNNVLSRQLEIAEVEQALRASVKGVDEEIKVFAKNIANVDQHISNLSLT